MEQLPWISSWRRRWLLPLVFATLALNTLVEQAAADDPSSPKKDTASESANASDPSYFVLKEILQKVSAVRFENNRVYFDVPERKNASISLQAYIYVLMEEELKKLWTELDGGQFAEGFYDKWSQLFLSKAQKNGKNMLPGVENIKVSVQETGIVAGGALQTSAIWTDIQYISTTSYQVTITLTINGQPMIVSIFITSKKSPK